MVEFYTRGELFVDCIWSFRISVKSLATELELFESVTTQLLSYPSPCPTDAVVPKWLLLHPMVEAVVEVSSE